MPSVIIYAIGGLAEQLIGVLVSPVMTRLLSPDQYGILGLVAAFFSTTALFRVVGMDWAFPYFRIRFAEAKDLTVLRSTATYVATAGLIITAVGFLIGCLATNWLPAFFRIEDPLSICLIASWLFVSGINGWYLYILRYENLPIGFIKVSLIKAILLPLLFIPVAWLISSDNRLMAFFFLSILTYMISSAKGLIEIRGGTGRRLYNRNFFSASLTKEMLTYGAVLVPSGFFYAMITVSDRYLLAWLSNTAEIGIYSLALSISGLLLMLKGWFNLAWGPYILDLIQKNPRELYEKVVNRTMYYVAVLFTGVAVILGLWTHEVIAFIYPKSFAKASLMVPPLLMSGALSGLSLVANVSVVISQIKKYHFFIYGLGLLLNVGVCLILIPILGGVGAAAGILAAEIFILVSWIVVTNLLTDNIKLILAKPLAVCSVFSMVLLLHMLFSFPWQMRLIATGALIAYMIREPESLRILAWSRQFLSKRGDGDNG
jgi:O-antigen/teichoic acid export membrane protein